MESIEEMINMGWRVYFIPADYKGFKKLKIVKLYRYPNLIFVKNKNKKHEDV